MLTSKEAIVNNEIILIDETTLSSQVIGKCTTAQLWHAYDIIKLAGYTKEEYDRKRSYLCWALYNRYKGVKLWSASQIRILSSQYFEFGAKWDKIAEELHTTPEKVRFQYLRGSIMRGRCMADKILDAIDPNLPEEDQNLTAEDLGRKVAEALLDKTESMYINEFFRGFCKEIISQKKTNNIAVPIKRNFNLFDRKEVSDMRTEMMNQFHKLTGIETPFIEKDSIIRFENRLKQSE